MLIDLRNKGVTGKAAEESLGKAGFTINKNMVPFDDKSPFVTSGIRLGTAALTTRGLKEADFVRVADMIDQALQQWEDDAALERMESEVAEWMSDKPLFAW